MMFSAERGIAARKYSATSIASSSDRPWHAPASNSMPDVALDPRERVFLADRDQHVVARDVRVGLAGRHQVAAALVVVLGLDLREQDAG